MLRLVADDLVEPEASAGQAARGGETRQPGANGALDSPLPASVDEEGASQGRVRLDAASASSTIRNVLSSSLHSLRAGH